MYLQAINKVKITYQGQGHTSRSRSNQGQHQIKVIFKERYSYAGGLHLNQMRSCLKFYSDLIDRGTIFGTYNLQWEYVVMLKLTLRAQNVKDTKQNL